jgi:hypothetical protein
MDVTVRLSVFIPFCIGIQIIWTGMSDLLGSVTHLEKVRSMHNKVRAMHKSPPL